VKLNLDGRPGDVERVAEKIMAEVARDPDVRFMLTISRVQGKRDPLWANPDFCERHARLSRRLAELDPQDQHRLLPRFMPECAAFLRGQPEEARKLILGPDAYWPDVDTNLFALDMPALALNLTLPDFDLPD
jgi:hypothetical protein